MTSARLLRTSMRAAGLHAARQAPRLLHAGRTFAASAASPSNESHERPSDINPTAGSGDSRPGHVQDNHLLNKSHRLDIQSDAAGEATSERGQAHGPPDAVKAASEKTNGQYYSKQREESISETSKQKLGWQPGQGGEQVGGYGGGEGKVGESRTVMDENFLGKAKKVLGFQETRAFSTAAMAQREGDSKARKVKDTGVSGEQNPHLHHHGASSGGDASPAVRDSASLPSHGGSQFSSTSPGTGSSATPKEGSFAGDVASLGQDEHPQDSKVLASTSRPGADYKHVRGAPEPDSFREGYETLDGEESAAGSPSGRVRRSSTSGDAYNTHTTRDHPHNSDGIGRSHTIETLDDAVEALHEGKGKTSGGEHAKGGITYEQPSGSEDLQYQKQMPPEFNEDRARFRPPMDKKPPKYTQE